MHNIKELKALASDIKILYVEDETELRDSVKSYLEKIFEHVDSAEDGKDGLTKYKNSNYDIVITDILMPFISGIDMITEIMKIKKEQEVIIISAQSETSYFVDAIKLGVSGYILKPIRYEQMNTVLFNTVNKLITAQNNASYKKYLERTIQRQTSKVIDLQKHTIENFENTILALVQIIEERDSYTGGHSQRIANYSKLIAKEMGKSAEDCEMIYQAGILHDIGKIVTPDAILLKPDKLNDLEYSLIQEHVEVGYQLLSKIPMYKEIAEIMAYHHERYDGTGYPYGLKADNIPILSRIMTVADSFDAMTTNRIYKARMSVNDSLKELKKLSGTQFDANVVEAASKVLKKVQDTSQHTQEPFTNVEKARFAYFHRDQITGAYNIEYLNFTLNKNFTTKRYTHLNVVLLRNFNQYNEKYGWSSGDKFLNNFVHQLKEFCPKAVIFRMHGDDFVLLAEKNLKTEIEIFDNLKMIKENDLKVDGKYINLEENDIANSDDIEAFINS